MKQFAVIMLCFIFGFGAIAQDKIPVKSIDDLPKHNYQLEERDAFKILEDKAIWSELANQVQQNLEADLEKYDIQDHKTLRNYHKNLRIINRLKGNFDAALKHTELQRKYTDKEENKLALGLMDLPLIRTQKANVKEEAAFKAHLEEEIKKHLAPLPFDKIEEDIKGLLTQFEIMSDNIVKGLIQAQLQPKLNKAGDKISLDLANHIIGMVDLQSAMPYFEVYKKAFKTYYDENHVEVKMADIWSSREVAITKKDKAEPVVIGVWDSGVDTDIFEKTNQLWTNTKEKADGKDTDGNGFIDDIHGIAYDVKDYPVTELLFSFTKTGSDKDEVKKLAKGYDDLQNQIDSDESSYFKKAVSKLKPNEINPFIEELNKFGTYTHGTHVAGIMAKDNAAARLLTSRITFNWEIFSELVTKESIQRSADLYTNSVAYFKANNVKVVNMSWSSGKSGIVRNLEEHGVGKSEEERNKIADEYFSILRNALYNAIKDAPEILFVCAAGNSNGDVNFAKKIPSSLDLPNLMVVGAVNKAGEETSFTTMGKNVDVYANGYKVESYIPGGETDEYSGTSMASPQVANLAGKILAKHPNLKPTELKALIIKGATVSEKNEKVLLIHPQNSMNLANKNR